MSCDECPDVRFGSWFTDRVGNIDRKKIGTRDKAIDGVQANMIGIDMPAFCPAEFLDGRVPRVKNTLWLRANKSVLAIRFIPNGSDIYAFFGKPLKCTQLGFCLMSETIADTDRIFV